MIKLNVHDLPLFLKNQLIFTSLSFCLSIYPFIRSNVPEIITKKPKKGFLCWRLMPDSPYRCISSLCLCFSLYVSPSLSVSVFHSLLFSPSVSPLLSLRLSHSLFLSLPPDIIYYVNIDIKRNHWLISILFTYLLIYLFINLFTFLFFFQHFSFY